jgi:hypothetical protein
MQGIIIRKAEAADIKKITVLAEFLKEMYASALHNSDIP